MTGLTHQDLAESVGTYRETATQVLNDLKSQGLIRDRPQAHQTAGPGDDFGHWQQTHQAVGRKCVGCAVCRGRNGFAPACCSRVAVPAPHLLRAIFRAMYDRSTQVDRSVDSINFGIGQPDFDLLPHALIRQVATARFAEGDTELLNYGFPQETAVFRWALADFLSQGYGGEVQPQQLMTTAGRVAGARPDLHIFRPPRRYRLRRRAQLLPRPAHSAGGPPAEGRADRDRRRRAGAVRGRRGADPSPAGIPLHHPQPTRIRPGVPYHAAAARRCWRWPRRTTSSSLPTRSTICSTSECRRRRRLPRRQTAGACYRSVHSRRFLRRGCGWAGCRRRRSGRSASA